MEYRYLISIVMAIYNSELFLRGTLDSIVAQDTCRFKRPFEEIVQVIMVDDGSTDGTAEIIDEYAAKYPNFFPIHKSNGGVASARNEGLKYVEGKYMNFLDSDDKFSRNVLWEMYSFFEKHYDETDVVTMPLYLFDAASGAHWQNGKFNKGSRVINLYKEYNSSLMFVNASFFKSEYKDKVFFDSNLVCGEDIKYIYTILSEKMSLGVTNRCKYYYRQRSAGEESLIQGSKKKKGWYFEYFKYLIDWGVDFSQAKFSFVPQYVQNLFVMDLAWRFREKYESMALSVLGADEFIKYKETLYGSLRYFDDEIIMSLRNIYIEHKVFMLSKKYGYLPKQVRSANDVGLIFDKKPVCWISDLVSYIDFMNINGNVLTIEGYTMVCGVSEDEPVDVKLIVRKWDGTEITEQSVACSIPEERDVNHYKLGEVLFRGIPFVGSVSLDYYEFKAEIALAVVMRGNTIVKKDIRFKAFSPIGKEYKKGFYSKSGYTLTKGRHFIYFEKFNARTVKERQKNFMAELKNSKKESDRKAFKALTAYAFLKKVFRNKIWLISDRVNKADDNGETLFKYLCEIKPKGVDIFFVIDRACSDYERLKKMGEVVPCFSHKHKMLHLLADVIISSSADDLTLNPFGKFKEPYRNIIANQKFVFLQHGVIKDDLSEWLNRYNKNFSGFVTSAMPEYQSVVDNSYFYSCEKVWLTGLPRHDRLYNDSKKYVTIMPTWRKYIMENKRGVWFPNNKFSESAYCIFYNELLNDQKLIYAAKNLGYTICFLPHVNTQTCVEFFHQDENVLFFGLDKPYREIFAESDMIITDYSSVAFDFAYLRKPLIYTQFDKEEFYNGEHVYTKGYFDYERDGFGEVTYDLKSTVDMIVEYMKNNCQLKDKYHERIDGFFAFHDKNNCQRVYKRIVEMLEEKC